MRYEYHATNGEDALIEIDENDMVVACNWGYIGMERDELIEAMENGDYPMVELLDERLDDPIPYEEFVETQLRGNRLLATMEA